MARGSRRCSRRRGGQGKATQREGAPNAIGALTLNDFANSPTGKGRLKKAASNSIAREVKQLCNDGDSLAWYEKDMEEFDIELENRRSGLEEDLALVRERKPRRHRSKASEESTKPSGTERDGRDYPLDVWFILSEYMRPEDVCRFALICRSALYVCNSAKFWYGLYKRYYRRTAGIPERLQPECMERPCGLRQCVVRSLFYCYQPFVDRLKPITSFESEPYSLVRAVCVMQWHQKVKDQWHFFFKLHHRLPLASNPHPYSPSHPRPPDLLEMLGDVNSNSDMGCRVLQVIGNDFSSVPVVLGLTLVNVYVGLSQGLQHHCLRLAFGPPHLPKKCLPQHMQVNLDPVLNLKVLDWWHPCYPHPADR